MNVIPLDWDSAFFGLRIAKVILAEGEGDLRLFDEADSMRLFSCRRSTSDQLNEAGGQESDLFHKGTVPSLRLSSCQEMESSGGYRGVDATGVGERSVFPVSAG